jgi:hypothetical protein
MQIGSAILELFHGYRRADGRSDFAGRSGDYECTLSEGTEIRTYLILSRNFHVFLGINFMAFDLRSEFQILITRESVLKRRDKHNKDCTSSVRTLFHER